MKALTADQVKAKFEREGKSFAEWSRERGYKLQSVYYVLNGQHKAKRGIAHQIAVDLGMKEKLAA